LSGVSPKAKRQTKKDHHEAVLAQLKLGPSDFSALDREQLLRAKPEETEGPAGWLGLLFLFLF